MDNPEGHSRMDNPEGHSRMDNPEGHSRVDNPEGHSRMDNPEGHSRMDNPEGHSRMDNPETLATFGTEDTECRKEMSNTNPIKTLGVNPGGDERFPLLIPAVLLIIGREPRW